MKSTPFLVSIIVPIYRVEAYLEKCVNSLLNQTYHNIEIILVDDGSDDACPEICDTYRKKDERIVVIHKTNGGLNSARVAGVKESKGEYISYVDSDDWVEPDFIEMMVSIVMKTNCKAVNSGIIDNYDEKEVNRVPFFDEGLYEGDDFFTKIVPRIFYTGFFFQYGIEPYLCTKLIKRDLIEKYQYRLGVENVIADGLMVSIPAILDGKSVYISHECKYHYRVRENSSKRADLDSLPQIINNNIENWRATLKLTGFYDECISQFNCIVFYWLVLKKPGYFDKEKLLTAYGGIEKGSKIIIFGAGVAGYSLVNYIKRKDDVKLQAWVDSNAETLKVYYDVQDKEVINQLEYDYIIVAVLRRNAYESIMTYLAASGIDKDKIRWVDLSLLNRNYLK